MRRSIQILTRLYALLLNLYPRAYRVEYGEERQAVYTLAVDEAAQQGGFSVIVGEPSVGKRILKEHLENLDKNRENTVESCSRTLHT